MVKDGMYGSNHGAVLPCFMADLCRLAVFFCVRIRVELDSLLKVV